MFGRFIRYFFNYFSIKWITFNDEHKINSKCHHITSLQLPGHYWIYKVNLAIMEWKPLVISSTIHKHFTHAPILTQKNKTNHSYCLLPKNITMECLKLHKRYLHHIIHRTLFIPHVHYKQSNSHMALACLRHIQ